MSPHPPLLRAALALALGLLLAVLAGCATPAPHAALVAADPADSQGRLLIVAVVDGPQAQPAAGASPRAAYRLGAGYAGSDAAQAVAQSVAADHALTEISAWTIDALRLRCMLFRLPPGADRDEVLRLLGNDPRVQLVQPVQQFETYGQGAAAAPAYNDPYLTLQLGFARMGAAAAQRLGRGEGVRVAVIDTVVDAGHPDLAERVLRQRDFATGLPAGPAERHGTEVAGILAAVENNRIGIAGVAPAVQVLAYRACWSVPAPAQGDRCDTFSLAQALAQAISDRADVINLSLGGPADPLLQRLVEAALQRGTVVVGALPPSGRAEGFPTGVPGVLAAAVAEAGTVPPGALPAPGREVLTLQRHGAYGLATGSSMAAAHISGAVALLRSLQPRLDGPAAYQLLQPTSPAAGMPVGLCQAAQRLRPAAAARCEAVP